MLVSKHQSKRSNIIALQFVTPLVLLLLPGHVPAAAFEGSSSAESTTASTHHGDAMISWLRSNDTCSGNAGYVHPGVEMRRLPYSKNNRTYGVFAATDFQINETLLEIPRDCILLPRRGHVGDRIEAYIQNEENDGAEYFYGRITAVHENADTTGETSEKFLYDVLFDDGDVATEVALGDFFDFESLPLNCATARTLADELRLGSSSKFGPYIQYLWETQQPANELLPSGWSPAGQELLHELVVSVGKDKNQDVPYGLLETLNEDWFDACEGDPTDEVGVLAATLTVMRAWDERLIPVYDTFNHRNGHWNNIDNDAFTDDLERVRVYAKRNIQAGEQLYISYNMCNDCGGRLDDYGTPEILRDYGFVEEYPRRFLFPGVMGFDLDVSEQEQGEDLHLTWLHGRKPHPVRGRKWLQQQWTRLYDLNETALAVRDPRIESDHEWNVIVQYHEALVTALRAAWRAMTGSDIVLNDGDETACRAYGRVGDTTVCSLESDRYNDLLEEKVEDWASERPATCDYFGIYNLDSWDSVEVIKSHYQKMVFLVHHTFGKRDTCFDLEDTVQICESYRPHYHEMIVHYTARFIERVERVLFVGGGDSMLLHEILKYPTLQKVVGLELDQQVVRASFRHFGTQPHFDNDKVEWWFGDATKSLMMLPREYFGSFDMVLVDLSETVMALSVTDELVVMQALTLLLRPSGILVKNEVMYFPEMKSIFRHTLNLHYYDVPIVCSQALILGSNSVAFPRAKVYDHHIETLVKLLDDPHHEVMHDYQYNATIDSRYCAKNNRDKATLQKASPGIVMIVEADDTESKQMLQSGETLGAALEKGLEEIGLSVISRSLLHEDNNGVTIMLLLNEGCIVSRSFPEQSYCGFDIMLWSEFEQMNRIKTALADVVESKTVSQYRIVSGGMFGLPSWQEDEWKRGPEAAHVECGSDSAPSASEDGPDTELVKATLRKTSQLIGSLPADGSVVVLCRFEGQHCTSLNVFKEFTEFDLIPLWTCDDFTNEVEYSQDGPKEMFECQKSIYFTLEEAVIRRNRKIRAIVIDSGVSYPMGRIVHRLMINRRNAHRWLDKDGISVIAPFWEKRGAWRRLFVDALRKEIIIDEPVFASEVYLNSTAFGSLTLILLKSGDRNFLQKLDDTLVRIEEDADVGVSIISFRGGQLQFQENFHPTQSFSHEEFDNQDATKQWQSQKPLGYQDIFQLEGKVENCASVTAAITNTMNKFVAQIGSSKTEQISASRGDGCLVTARWSGGNVIATWDGRRHVNVNLYLADEDQNFARSFSRAFAISSKLEVTLRDVQPRGSGRLVNFRSHVDSRQEPHWTSTA